MLLIMLYYSSIMLYVVFFPYYAKNYSSIIDASLPTFDQTWYVVIDVYLQT